MTPEQFHARIWDILKPVDDAAFEVVAAPAPDEEAIAAITTAVGFPPPAAFTAFSRRTNGLCLLAREEVWPHAKQFEVGPAWTFWRGLVLLGFDAEDLPEWASITAAHRELADAGISGILPLLKVVGDGGRIWGIDASGATVLVMYDEVTPLAGDVTALFAEQVAELVQRQQDMAKRIESRRR